MATLGQQLKQAREEKSISLQEIAESTHISIRFLQAIENDAYDVLPGGVFNRAFVRKFASKVGFDEEQAVNLYQEQWQEQGGAEPERGYQLGVEDFEARQTTGNGLLLSFVALVVIGSLAYAAYQYFTPAAADPSGSAASGLSSSPSVTPTPTPAATPSPSPSSSPSPDVSPTPSPSPVALAGVMRVVLSAPTEEVWLKIKTDDKEAERMLLHLGESREFEVSEKIILSTGRAQSLKIAINGRDMDFTRFLLNPKANTATDVSITKANYQQYLN
jgi:cytoskeleton protein RodZ